MTNDKECGFDGGDCCLPYIRSSHLQSLNISDVYWADQLTLFQPGGHIMPPLRSQYISRHQKYIPNDFLAREYWAISKVWYRNCKWLGLLNSVFSCGLCVCKNHFDDENVTFPVITTLKLICPVPHLIGNGVCDKEAYNDSCEWDRNDCGNY